MSHIALYRTWRPQAFRDVVGQEHITKTLQNALREQRFSHAYLFSGPRGTGKTSAAKIVAKAVNCEDGPADEPCNRCRACEMIGAGAVMDVMEIDAASNRGVEEIRDIRDNVKYAPSEVRYKVYIIDEVHMLTTEAFNALLKTLEEPPAHVIFILATTEPHRIPATILSRCQRFDFRRVSLEDQVRRMERICDEESIEIEPEALQYIARLSDGGMRDALSLLDQAVSYTGGKITCSQVIEMTGGIASEQFEALAEKIRERDVGSVLEWVETLFAEGKSADKCMESLIQYYRDLLVIRMVPEAESMTDRILDVSRFRDVAQKYDERQIFGIIEVLNRYQTEMKYAGQPQTLFEVALMKLCCPDEERPSAAVAGNAASPMKESADELLRRVSRLEERLAQLEKNGVADRSGSGPPADVRNAERESGRQVVEDRDSAAAGTETGGHPVSSRSADRKPAFGGTSAVKTEQLLQNHNPDFFREVCRKWNEVLGQVKERKITVYAWLVDGEPAAAGDAFVLVAFKNAIHRQTTDKPANKQLIEQVLEGVFDRSLTLHTVMRKDWEEMQAAAQGDPGRREEAEPLQLEPESPEPEEEKYKQDWIKEAVEWFGEDLVTVKTEETHSHTRKEEGP